MRELLWHGCRKCGDTASPLVAYHSVGDGEDFFACDDIARCHTRAGLPAPQQRTSASGARYYTVPAAALRQDA